MNTFATSPTKEPQVFSEVTRLGNNLDKLEKTISELQEKLGPIIRPPETQKEQIPCDIMKLVPLADSIRNQADKTYSLEQFVRNIITRLEI